MPLAPKAFDVLRYLVEHSQRLVTQDEILEALWPGTYVNQEVIRRYILAIRKALGDRADQAVFIETFHKRGYQFIAPVREENGPIPTEASTDVATKMVGRETALAALDGSLRKALQGRRQVIFITGEAGIGKTTLVDVFQQQTAGRPNLRVARGQCVEGFGGKEAYYPMLEALGQLVRETPNPVAQALARRAPTWLIQFPSLVKDADKEGLQQEILGTTRERMVREICEALEAITAENPLVLIFEDLHWVDLSTLDLISAFARRREPSRLLLIGTYRPADLVLSHSPLKGLKQDLQIHHLCEEVRLERLEEPEVTEYLARELQNQSLPKGLANLIYRHSGGNALFMVAIVQDMLAKGLLAQDKAGLTLTRPVDDIDPGVPETLQKMLEVQFEQLNEVEQIILKSASVAGERFSVWLVAATLNLEPERIEELCEGLTEKQQVIKSAGIQELPDGNVSAHYEFRHSLYREVLYRRLSHANRTKLHRILGERLQNFYIPDRQGLASELAQHFEAGHQYERAIYYSIRAAENAGQRFAHRDSLQILRHALQLVPKAPANVRAELEIQLLELIGDVHYWLGAMMESISSYEAAAVRAAQSGIKAAEVSALSRLVRPFGLTDPDRGIAAVERALQVSMSLGNPLLAAQTQMLAASIRLIYDTWRQKDWETCVAAKQLIDSLSTSGLPLYHRMIYARLQLLQGHYREGLWSLEAGIPKSGETTDLMGHFFALSGKTVALLHLGQFGELLRIVRAATEMAEKDGNDPWLFIFREAWLRTLALDFEGARRVCEAVIGRTTGYLTGQPKTIARLATGYAELDQGRYSKAIRNFRQILDPKITPKFFLHWYWRMNAQLGLSNVWLASGDLVNARSEAGHFLETALLTADPNLQALAWEVQTRVAMAEKDWSGAEKTISKGIEVVEKFDVPVTAWRVYATAWDVYRATNNEGAAEPNRARAEHHILALANSFGQDDPLRDTFLAAAPVRRILTARETGSVRPARRMP